MGELHTHKHTHQQDFLQTSLKNEFENKTAKVVLPIKSTIFAMIIFT